MLQFVADGGFRTMTGIYNRIGRQGAYTFVQGVDEPLVIASDKIGAAYAAAEESVAAAYESRFGRIEGNTAGRVSRSIYDLQRFVTDIEGVAVGKVFGYGDNVGGSRRVEGNGLLFHHIQQRLFGSISFDLDFVSMSHKRYAIVVVYMQVCEQQVLHRQTIVGDKAGERFLLVAGEATRVDDGALQALFVPQYVGELLKRVECKPSYFHLIVFQLYLYIDYFLGCEERLGEVFFQFYFYAPFLQALHFVLQVATFQV